MFSGLKDYFFYLLKGAAMGTANVIPGVSGGTIALITGIFERLINAIKSFNLKALKLLFKWDIKALIKHLDLYFLISVLFGIAIAIISLARILDFLFNNYPILVWAYFFGLILASVYFIGKRISKLSISVIIVFLIGAAIAVVFSVLTPATENDSLLYVFSCGAVAACSMILPGLSGSFVLILMGNYELVMIDSINNLDWGILIPVIIGAGAGLLVFSYILSWIFKRFKDQTLAILTGFILGSLSILWPWKETVKTFVNRHGEIKPAVQKNIMPGKYSEITGEPNYLLWAILLMIIGIISIWILERSAEVIDNKES